ncbi:MAG: hypothetical protein LBO66_04090 [Deltaproteobacteria bacterium]|jgi:hypothetical protein|nr:hypothetical protein [Deltaproteobacteria bacterium]
MSFFFHDKKILCPFCFNVVYLNQTPFRCVSHAKLCAPVPDQVLIDIWNDNRPTGQVIFRKDAKFNINSTVCPKCNQITTNRLCPYCHSSLPYAIGDFNNYIFSLVGAKESGKSHYLSTLIKTLKEGVSENLNFNFSASNDETVKRYNDDFFKPIFREKQTIAPTASVLAQKNQPLVYNLLLNGKTIFGGEKIKKGASLVFFDTAGEDLNDSNIMATLNKYIYLSDGIIFLIDPLQITDVRNKLLAKHVDPSILPNQNTPTIDVIEKITNLIQRGRLLRSTSKISIPIAVAFTKFDALSPLIDNQFQITKKPKHLHGFDITDFNSINSEMIGLLKNWNCHDILNHITVRYKYYGFFGLSALGNSPILNKIVNAIKPHRVEDPILWLMHKNRLIKKVKR